MSINPVILEFESLGHAMLGEGKPFYRSGKKTNLSAMRPGNKFILVRTGQVYSIKDNGSIWNETENRPSRLHKNCQVEPLYPAPVHASDISQERVDETAKREHDIVGACVTCGAPHGFWLSAPPTDFISPSVVKAISKREWVGLTEDEKQFFKAMGFSGIDIVEAKLKEKNS